MELSIRNRGCLQVGKRRRIIPVPFCYIDGCDNPLKEGAMICNHHREIKQLLREGNWARFYSDRHFMYSSDTIVTLG